MTGSGQHSVPFHLDIAPPRRRHDDATEFTVLVLWLTGFSAGTIASQLGLRRGQVLGIVARSAFEKRSSMDDDKRQNELNLLRAIRTEDGGPPLDGGTLDRFDWKILPIADARRSRRR